MNIVREPLVQFLLLGLLIFLAAEWQAARTDTSERRIQVDQAMLDYLENLYSVQFGYYPDASILEQLVDSHIRDEVLFREAVKLGLAQDDEIIRRRMVQKLEYLLLDNELPQAPDQATLSAWYQQHQDQYMAAASASFVHIYFRSDDGNEASAQQRAEQLLARTADPQPNQGDRFPLQSVYGQQTPASVRQQFGQSAFSEAVFTITPGVWAGPFSSGYGIHLLKVTERRAEHLQPLAELEQQVLEDWLRVEKTRRYDQRIAELISTYQIERP